LKNSPIKFPKSKSI